MENLGRKSLQISGLKADEVFANHTVDRGHQQAGHIASDIRQALPEASVTTHLEPLDAACPAAPQRAKCKRSDG